MMDDAPEPLAASTLTGDEGLIHGFFTREGGVSKGIHAGLNVGFGSDDDRDAVAENRRRCMAAFGLDADRLTTVYQVHGTDVVTLSAPVAYADAPRADAMVTDRPGIALGILTADCGPILFADPEARVIGAAHAGWKGAFAGVALATVEAMEALGADRASIKAALGPSIAQPSYEVGPEFFEHFVKADEDSVEFFCASTNEGRHMFDLKGYIGRALYRIGLASVELMPHDTCVDEERFYSYRRATLRGEPDYGRQLSAIALLPE